MTTTQKKFPPQIARKLRTLRTLKWRNDDALRCAQGDCPLLALAHQKKIQGLLSNGWWREAAKSVRINRSVATKIVNAADHRDDPYRPHLLALLGVKE